MHRLAHLLSPEIADSFLAQTELWHREPASIAEASELSILLTQLHRANFDLWHHEDQARDPRSTDGEIASTKRTIDQVNQRRNDIVEQVDLLLLDALGEIRLSNPDAPLHSETPGLMLDRLSILSLKIFHTREEIQRSGRGTHHVQRNRERLAVLKDQSSDLAGCLGALWSETLNGTRRFKQYRQLKMYNDPDLNPALYQGGTM